jgi:adenosine deaminase
MRAAHELDDETLAELAAMSIRASCAPDDTKTALLAEVTAWLTRDPMSATMTP